jgi:hypothetical protein
MPTGLQKTNKKQKKEQTEQTEQTEQKSQKQKTKKRTPPDLFLPDSFTYENTSSPVNIQTPTRVPRFGVFAKRKSLRRPSAKRQPTPETPKNKDSSILFCHNGICIRKAANGVGTFATRNIPTGSSLLREKPHNLADKYNNDEYKYMLIRKLLDNPETKARFESLVPTSLDPSDENVVPYSNIERHHRTHLPNLTPEQARLYVMKYNRNAFSCNNQPGILFTGTRMNHSCNPNVSYHMDGDHMVFKAKRPIRRNEEVFDSYITPTLPHSERQDLLYRRYGFRCNCDKCMEANKHK